MALAGVDEVVDGGFVIDHALRFVFDLGVEIAFRLEVVAQVALAFQQQGVVYRMLFEHRHQAAQLTLRDFSAYGVHFNFRPSVDIEGWLTAVGVLVVVHRFQSYARLKAATLFVFCADIVQAVAHAGLVHGMPAAYEQAAPMGGAFDIILGHFRIAGNDGICEMRARSRIHDEVDAYLLRARIIRQLGVYMALVQAIAGK